MLTEVTLADLEQAQVDGAVIVDVRESEEYRAGHVAGAISIPLSVVPVRAHELTRDQPVYLVCQGGGRSFQAAESLDRAGYDARSVAGGTGAWLSAGKPVVTGRSPR
ncbi:MAG: rhodanese-like domain-containing protein [Actinomycetota bacterium]|nr:rhodanese-like domain-containing protein [Actinomycetota bacterium]